MATAPIQVLLIEDNPVDGRAFQNLLKDFSVQWVQSLQGGLAAARARRPDVVLLDLSLSDSEGLETVTAFHKANPALPVLVLSGHDDDTLALNAVREGAQDYLVKGRVDLQVLTRAIGCALQRQEIDRKEQESREHFQHLVESTSDYSYTVEVHDGLITRHVHGPGCLNVTGYNEADFENDPELWVALVPDEDRSRLREQEATLRTLGSPLPMEHRLRHRSGELRWVRNTLVKAREHPGGVTHYDGIIADITQRKRAEEQLIASEAFYHSLVENLPQNIFRKDLNERFTFANQRFCLMLGKTLPEIIGRTDFDFFPRGLAAKYQQDDRYVIDSGETFETIEENQATNGEKIYVNVVKTPIHDVNGNIIGIQGIFWDITERKRFEEQLQRANENLTRTNEELKSAQAQLIQAEKMESLGTLAAGVAHEVKNPLAIILMGLNFLSKRLAGTDENVDLVLKEMRDAVERADSITRGLLDFSAKHELSRSSQDLNRVIQDILRLMRHELEEKQIVLVKELSTSLPRVRIDRNQIQQVFVNLLLNAMHAMPEGGTLSVRTYLKQLSETSHYEGSRRAEHFYVGDLAVVAEVDDTGGGIPTENLAKIFDPFFTTKPTGVGTGLGLPVSRKIVELHGGTLAIRNLPRGGVRVTMMLKATGTSYGNKETNFTRR